MVSCVCENLFIFVLEVSISGKIVTRRSYHVYFDNKEGTVL